MSIILKHFIYFNEIVNISLNGICKKNARRLRKLRSRYLALQQSGHHRAQYSFNLFMGNLASGQILIRRPALRLPLQGYCRAKSGLESRIMPTRYTPEFNARAKISTHVNQRSLKGARANNMK